MIARRAFLRGLAAAATGGVATRAASADEPPPETTRIALGHGPGVCIAPQYVVSEFLASEGFSDVRYVKVDGGAELGRALATGEVNVSMHFVGSLIAHVDAGDPIVHLAGLHVGCFELFGNGGVRAIRDLRGKVIAVPDLGPTAGQYILVSALLKYVGLDPRKDVRWAVHPPAEGRQLFAEGRVDAYLGWPPEPQTLKARRIGHVVVNTSVDRPWSQYFCCFLAANRHFVSAHPVATKRIVRAFLKATDLCAREPERVARMLVERGYMDEYVHGAAALRNDIPYDRWRQYDPEDTVRFYALRMHEAGMIRSHAQRIIAQGTDWRFLNELKRQLKG